jgi:hypothetical protein
MSSVWQTVVDFFVGRGWSQAQAQGIAGNLHYESGGFNTSAVGDGGKAYGLAQWHPDRQSLFQRVFGFSIKGSSLENQLAFVDYELRNNEKTAGNKLSETTTVADATRVFMQYYERPANMSSLSSRVRAAGGGLGESIGNMFGDFIGWTRDPLGIKDFNATDLDPTGISGFLRDFFTGKMAARFSAVIIGVILVALAIAAFVLTSDTGSKIVKTIKP